MELLYFYLGYNVLLTIFGYHFWALFPKDRWKEASLAQTRSQNQLKVQNEIPKNQTDKIEEVDEDNNNTPKLKFE